jgi:prepilin-type N-terminal cleavage/methylation domain-containing protein
MNTHSPKSMCRRAFTLIELLVVIAIIALLVSILLPSLASARDTARDLLCKNNMRQIGLGIQMYLDDQKEAYWFDLYARRRSGGPGVMDHWIAQRALKEYVGEGNSKIWRCPRAQGRSSVIDPTTRLEMTAARRIHIDPDPTVEDITMVPGTLQQDPNNIQYYTEYWFNDSASFPGLPGGVCPFPPGPIPPGFAPRAYRTIKHPEYLVWMADARDEIPRHGGKTREDRAIDSNSEVNRRSNKIYMLFGDQAIREFTWRQCIPAEARDPYGAPGAFYNWGHYYP